MHNKSYFILLLLLLSLYPAQAQTTPPEGDLRHRTWEVFMQQNIDTTGTDRLIFIDTLTGDEVRVETLGEHYTPVERAVMFFNPANRRVMLASPDGSVRPHPFIETAPLTRRIDWVFSDDHSLLAWTLTNGSDPARLTTVTYVANSDGTDLREILVDEERDTVRVLPLAFNTAKTELYMDYQPDGVSAFTPIPQYAGLFALDLGSSSISFLPEEPGCFCGAGIGAGWFLRLAVQGGSFDLNVYDLTAEVKRVIPALRLQNYTQAGNILIAPSGSRAVYALAQISGFGTPRQSVETVFMLVDLVTMTQTRLTDPLTIFLQPAAWTQDESGILFTSPQVDGTWKVTLGEGELVKVAEAAYLGVIQPIR